MKKPGRKSAAEMAVAPVQIDAARQRPPAPEELTEDQRELWKKVVSSLPAGWIKQEHHPILCDYCRHAIRARDLAARVDSTDISQVGMLSGPGLDTFDKLRRAAEQEGRAMLACARTLRITHQAQLRAETAATKRGESAIPEHWGKPWEM